MLSLANTVVFDFSELVGQRKKTRLNSQLTNTMVSKSSLVERSRFSKASVNIAFVSRLYQLVWLSIPHISPGNTRFFDRV